MEFVEEHGQKAGSAFLIRWIDTLLPPHFQSVSPDELRRARLLVGFSFISAVLAFAAVVLGFLVNTHSMTLVFFIATIAHVVNIGLVWWLRSIRLPAILFVLYGVLVNSVATYDGGLYSSAYKWQVVYPMLALFLLGRRWGLFFFALAILQATFFYLFVPATMPTGAALANHNTAIYSSTINLFLIMFFVIWLYESAQARMQRSLDVIKENSRRVALERDIEREANAAKSQFLANMSHELRTPLNAIVGYAELVQEELPAFGADELAPDLDKITDASHHLLGLIGDILDTTQLESTQLTLVAQRFSLEELLDETLKVVAPLARHSHNELRVELGEALGVVETDQRRLQQCVYKLLSNAAKFTEQGTITLRASRNTAEDDIDWIEIQVEDTGIGMDKDTVESLFQHFQQGDASSTKRYGGAGLGLSISYQLAQKMGGELRVKSKPGEGSLFTLTLPAVMPGQVLSPITTGAGPVLSV